MKKVLVLLTITAILVIACGCTQSSTPPQPTATMTTLHLTTEMPTVTTLPTLQTITSVSEKNKITINRTGFFPASITVKTGETVRWVNADSTEDYALYNPTHRIAVVNVDNSPPLSPGMGWSQIFNQPGSYDYGDMIHPTLKGIVIVV